MISTETTADTDTASNATAFFSLRGATWSSTATAAAPSNGVATGSGSIQLIRLSAHLREPVGIDRARLLVDVERQREDQADNRDADDDVRQRQRLHDRIDC